MSPLWIAAAAAAGLAAGPAERGLICVFAVRAGEPLRRLCPGCGGPLVTAGGRCRPPLTWWITGRCPHCAHRSGLPPLVTELVTSAVFALFAARAQSAAELGALCVLAAAGVALAFIDVAVHRLPDLLTLLAYAGVTGILLAAAAAGGHWSAFVRAVLAGAALACFYAVLTLLPTGAGGGDAKLALPVGTALGWYGWPVVFAATLYGFAAAAACALVLLAAPRSRGPRGRSFALGPFVLLGAFVAIFTFTTAL